MNNFILKTNVDNRTPSFSVVTDCFCHLILIVSFLLISLNTKAYENYGSFNDTSVVLRKISLQWIQKFDSIYFSTYRQRYITLSNSGDSYDFIQLGYGLDALYAVYLVTNDEKYLNDALLLINNVINVAESVEKIPFDGWKDIDSVKYFSWIHKSNVKTTSLSLEQSLYEGYFFRYVVKWLVLLDKRGWSSQNLNKYQFLLNFVVSNVWQKWYSRCQKLYNGNLVLLLNIRVHMAANWSVIALGLSIIDNNSIYYHEYKSFYSSFDKMLRHNLKPNSIDSRGYTWHATFDSNNIYSFKYIPRNFEIQDVSHANLVVSYLITAFEYGDLTWSMNDMRKLCNTVKYVIYNYSKNSFYPTLDRIETNDSKEWNSDFQADGWVKTGRFELDIQNIYSKYINENRLTAYSRNQGPQLIANMALNYYILSNEQ